MKLLNDTVLLVTEDHPDLSKKVQQNNTLVKYLHSMHQLQNKIDIIHADAVGTTITMNIKKIGHPIKIEMEVEGKRVGRQGITMTMKGEKKDIEVAHHMTMKRAKARVAIDTIAAENQDKGNKKKVKMALMKIKEGLTAVIGTTMLNETIQVSLHCPIKEALLWEPRGGNNIKTVL